MQPVPKCKEFTRPKSDPDCRIISAMLQLRTRYHAEYAIDVFVRGPHDRQLVWTTVCRDKAQHAGQNVTSGADGEVSKRKKVPSHHTSMILESAHPNTLWATNQERQIRAHCVTHNNVEQTLVPRTEHYTEVTSTTGGQPFTGLRKGRLVKVEEETVSSPEGYSQDCSR